MTAPSRAELRILFSNGAFATTRLSISASFSMATGSLAGFHKAARELGRRRAQVGQEALDAGEREARLGRGDGEPGGDPAAVRAAHRHRDADHAGHEFLVVDRILLAADAGELGLELARIRDGGRGVARERSRGEMRLERGL